MNGIMHFLGGYAEFDSKNKAEDLLSKEDITLEQMIDADDIVPEFRLNNEKVVEFFNPEKYDKMLEYSFGYHGSNQTAKQAGSCANILSSENPMVLKYFFPTRDVGMKSRSCRTYSSNNLDDIMENKDLEDCVMLESEMENMVPNSDYVPIDLKDGTNGFLNENTDDKEDDKDQNNENKENQDMDDNPMESAMEISSPENSPDFQKELDLKIDPPVLQSKPSQITNGETNTKKEDIIIDVIIVNDERIELPKFNIGEEELKRLNLLFEFLTKGKEINTDNEFNTTACQYFSNIVNSFFSGAVMGLLEYIFSDLNVQDLLIKNSHQIAISGILSKIINLKKDFNRQVNKDLSFKFLNHRLRLMNKIFDELVVTENHNKIDNLTAIFIELIKSNTKIVEANHYLDNYLQQSNNFAKLFKASFNKKLNTLASAYLANLISEIFKFLRGCYKDEEGNQSSPASTKGLRLTMGKGDDLFGLRKTNELEKEENNDELQSSPTDAGPGLDVKIPCVYDPNRSQKLSIIEALEDCIDQLFKDFLDFDFDNNVKRVSTSFGIEVKILGMKKIRDLEIQTEILTLSSESINHRIIESKVIDRAFDYFFMTPTNNMYHNAYTEFIVKALTDKTSSLFKYMLDNNYPGKFANKVYDTIKGIQKIKRPQLSDFNECSEIDQGFGDDVNILDDQEEENMNEQSEATTDYGTMVSMSELSEKPSIPNDQQLNNDGLDNTAQSNDANMEFNMIRDKLLHTESLKANSENFVFDEHSMEKQISLPVVMHSSDKNAQSDTIINSAENKEDDLFEVKYKSLNIELSENDLQDNSKKDAQDTSNIDEDTTKSDKNQSSTTDEDIPTEIQDEVDVDINVRTEPTFTMKNPISNNFIHDEDDLLESIELEKMDLRDLDYSESIEINEGVVNKDNMFKKDIKERLEDHSLRVEFDSPGELNSIEKRSDTVKSEEMDKVEIEDPDAFIISDAQKKIVNSKVLYMGHVKKIFNEVKKLTYEAAGFLNSELWKEFNTAYLKDDYKKEAKEQGKVPKSRKATLLCDEFKHDDFNSPFELDNNRIIQHTLKNKNSIFSATNIQNDGEIDENIHLEEEINYDEEIDNYFECVGYDDNPAFKGGSILKNNSYNEKMDYEMKLVSDADPEAETENFGGGDVEVFDSTGLKKIDEYIGKNNSTQNNDRYGLDDDNLRNDEEVELVFSNYNSNPRTSNKGKNDKNKIRIEAKINEKKEEEQKLEDEKVEDEVLLDVPEDVLDVPEDILDVPEDISEQFHNDSKTIQVKYIKYKA